MRKIEKKARESKHYSLPLQGVESVVDTQCDGTTQMLYQSTLASRGARMSLVPYSLGGCNCKVRQTSLLQSLALSY